jgi:hypothetical protein
MKKQDILESIALSVLSREDLEEELLMFMVLLHTHDIQLKRGILLEDAHQADPSLPIVLRAVTHRHAASIVASLWPRNDKRGAYEYWYAQYNTATPYEVVSDIPPAQLRRLDSMKERVLKDHRIEALKEA